jgi:transitional endoplasmic reticulum ATPase
MLRTFEAEQLVNQFDRDRKIVEEFLVKCPDYSKRLIAGENADELAGEVSEGISEVKKIVEYWHTMRGSDATMVRAEMTAQDLENLIGQLKERGIITKSQINVEYVEAKVNDAIERNDDDRLRKAREILSEVEEPDDRTYGIMRHIDAYFRVKEGNTTANPAKRRKRRADAPATEVRGEKAEPAEPAEIAVEPEEDTDDCDLEERLKKVKPASDIGTAGPDSAEASNGKGIAPPLRSQGFDPRKSKFQPEERPDYSFDDVVGLEDVKEQVKVKMVYPYTMPERAKELGLKGGGGILLYGPPGTGKTSMARAVAGEIGIPFFNINPDEIDGRTAEKTVANIRELFRVIRSYEKSVVFFDEVNVFFPTNPSTKSAIITNREFQTQLSGYDSLANSDNSRILLIGATNKPWALNRSMLRFERFGEKIYVGFPDAEAREGIFKMKLAGRDLAEDIDYKTLAEWTVDATSGDVYSGADIAQVCQRAAEFSLGHTAKTGEAIKIDMVILRNIIDQITPTGLTPNAYDSREMEKFRQEI